MQQILECQEEKTGHLADDKYDVIHVPPNRLKLVWNGIYPLLLKSMTSNPEMDYDDIIAGIFDRSIQVWVVARLDAGKVDAVFLTSIENDKGHWVVSLYNLGGSNPKAWVQEVHEAMHRFARIEDCICVRMCGRPAWQRILPGYPVVGMKGGHLIYERATECL